MNKFLLCLHVLAVILTIGPVAVAASMFPRHLRLAAGAADSPGESAPLTVARTLHRICQVYTLAAIAVPFFGLALAGPLHVFGQAWLIVSIVLTAAAAGLLAGVVLPGQNRALTALTTNGAPATTEAAPVATGQSGTATLVTQARPAPTDPVSAAKQAARLAMTTGIFNLLWAAVAVLMIVQPGSTTGG
ncbi:membrane protein [Pseudofrankia sp. DC12]|uniref:membrane protein n=1 Tax=Pseudofrankia sp. DC12 TaxID=683315 RepID=UPI0005F7F491|nr:membrane protein [Pseudofrankia sp. DC12]